MGFIKDWLDRRLAKEHEKLLVECRDKAKAWLQMMEALNAASPHPERDEAIRSLKSFQGELSRMGMGFAIEGKLRPKDADALIFQLRQLNKAAVIVARGKAG